MEETELNWKKTLAKLAVLLAAASISFLAAKQTEAASLNSLAKQNNYVGVTYLYKMLSQEGIKYNKFYTQNKIVYRNHGKPEGVVIHETADPGATAHDEAIYFNREWMNMYSYVHAFVDHQRVIQMMTPKYGAWGAGPMANDRFVQVELCEETDRNNFAKSINNDAIYVAKILHRYHLKPTNATHNGHGTVWSHAAVSKFLGGTDHGDPVGYFAKWGYSMDDFFNLIKSYYDLQGAETKPAKKKPEVVKKPERNTSSSKTLMHDARLYNAQGKKIKGKKKAGIVVKIIATKTINKKKYYQVGKNEYLLAANFDGKMRILKHNAYIYDTAGSSDGKTKLFKKSSIRTYGGQVKIAGVKYYAISASQFVKAQNF